MTNKYRRARKKRKKWWPYLLSFFLLVVLGSGIGAYLAKPSLFSGLQFWKAKKTAVTTPSSSKKKEEKSDFYLLLSGNIKDNSSFSQAVRFLSQTYALSGNQSSGALASTGSLL